MAWEYRIDADRRLVRVRFYDRVTDADLLAADDALREDREFRAGHDQLVDLSDATDADFARDIIGVLVARAPLFAPESRRAVVAPSDLAFGMSRLFEFRRGSEAGEIRTFRDAGEAQHWLADRGGPA